MNDIADRVFSNPYSATCGLLTLAGAYIIIAYYSGKWPLFGGKLNSRTKKSKKLITFGYVLTFASLIMLGFIIPYVFSSGESAAKSLVNPHLGEWVVKTSTNYEVELNDRVYYYISNNNTLVADFRKSKGKKFAFLRNNKIDHTDYATLEGDFSTYGGQKLDYESKFEPENESLIITCLEKNGNFISEIHLEKN